MVGWHHGLNGHEFEQAPGVGDGQGGLACCSPWARKESDMTEQLNNSEGCCDKSLQLETAPICPLMVYEAGSPRGVRIKGPAELAVSGVCEAWGTRPLPFPASRGH